MVFRRKGTPSLTRSVARTAIVANVAGRQMAKGAAAAAAKAAPPADAAPPAADAPAAGAMTPERLGMLKELAALRAVLDRAEQALEASDAKWLVEMLEASAEARRGWAGPSA